MSEEEEKTIEYFKESFNKTLPPFWYDDTIANNEEKIKILLNLINKLQKELQEEKGKNKKLEEQRKIDENSVIDLIAQVNAENERCCDLSVELDEVNKVINLMAEELPINAEICDKLKDSKNDCYADIADEKACCNCIKEYYFNKVKEKANDK